MGNGRGVRLFAALPAFVIGLAIVLAHTAPEREISYGRLYPSGYLTGFSLVASATPAPASPEPTARPSASVVPDAGASSSYMVLAAARDIAPEIWAWVGQPGFTWDVAEAALVAECESDGVADALNSSGATGLFQVMPIHIARVENLGFVWSQMFDPYINAVVAYDLWLDQGWMPWRESIGCHGLF